MELECEKWNRWRFQSGKSRIRGYFCAHEDIGCHDRSAQNGEYVVHKWWRRGGKFPKIGAIAAKSGKSGLGWFAHWPSKCIQCHWHVRNIAVYVLVVQWCGHWGFIRCTGQCTWCSYLCGYAGMIDWQHNVFLSLITFRAGAETSV